MSLTPGALPTVGEHVGRYEIVAEVARGGMAAVFAVRQRSSNLDKLFAIKLLLPVFQDESEMKTMFLDEARIASSIDHANVVQLVDLGDDNGVPFMVMEYLRGQSLSALRQRGSDRSDPPSHGVMLQVLAQAARGLHAAHETCDAEGRPLHIVHRDVSPQNIHVGYDGHTRVVDFGIAAARGRATKTRTGQIKGKFRYVAPEQIAEMGQVDRRVDVWAMGVVAWEALCGRDLFRADEEAKTLWNVLNKRVPALSEIVDSVEPEVSDIVQAALDRDPATRLASCEDLAAVFEAAVRGRGVGVADVATAMERLFGTDRHVENDHLRTVLHAPTVSTLASTLSIRELQAAAVSAAPRTRRWLPWAAAILIGVAGVALGASLRSPTTEPLANAPRTSVEPEAEVGAVEEQLAEAAVEGAETETEAEAEADADAEAETQAEAEAETQAEAVERARPRMRRRHIVSSMSDSEMTRIRRSNPYE